MTDADEWEQLVSLVPALSAGDLPPRCEHKFYWEDNWGGGWGGFRCYTCGLIKPPENSQEAGRDIQPEPITGGSDGDGSTVASLLRGTHTKPCRHCDQGPDADGDHSCPCPHPDDICPDHPLVLVDRALVDRLTSEMCAAVLNKEWGDLARVTDELDAALEGNQPKPAIPEGKVLVDRADLKRVCATYEKGDLEYAALTRLRAALMSDNPIQPTNGESMGYPLMQPEDQALVRTRSVLTRTAYGVYSRLPDVPGTPSPAGAGRWATLVIDPDLVQEFGDPEILTVTLERGDLLNGDDESVL